MKTLWSSGTFAKDPCPCIFPQHASLLFVTGQCFYSKTTIVSNTRYLAKAKKSSAAMLSRRFLDAGRGQGLAPLY